MKTFSSKRRASYRRNFSVTALVALVLIIVAVLLLFLFRGVFGTIGSFLTAPLFGAHAWLTAETGGPFSFLQNKALLEERIAELENTVLALRGSSFTMDRLMAENTALHALLGDTAEESRIAAGVIARPPAVPYDALLIDRGIREGIVEGAVVYYSADRVIGTIARAYENASVVKLFSTPLTKTTVYIVGANIYTTAHGAGGGVIRVSVPQGIVLTEGDLVLLPGLKGGVLGKISAIESQATNPEQNAYIVQDVPLQSLQIVGVANEAQPAITFEEARANIEAAKNTFLLDVPAGVLVDVGTTTATTTATTTQLQ
jgi:cell shape-determining protein MreC